MSKDERIILAVGFVGLVAILLYHFTDLKSNAVTAENDVAAPDLLVPSGQANYMTYNQPFLFSPPVANILPATASGILGQSFEQPPPSSYDDGSTCGC